MHRGEVRSRYAPVKAKPHRFGRQRLNVPGKGVIGLVAVHVYEQSTLRGDFAQFADRRRAVRHRTLEVGNSADDVYAAVERSQQIDARAGIAQKSVLWKCDELQIDVRRHRFPDVEQRIDRQ
jgi:hypothetical protein